MALWLFGVPAFCCLVPLLAPGWRSLLAIGLGLSGWLAWSWASLWRQLSDPAFDGAFGGAVAFMAMVLTTLALVSGVGGRSFGLVMQARGKSRAGVLWTDMLAVALPVGFLLALQLMD